MSKFPKITVVTVNFNMADTLEATLRSVLDQDYPNLEYIVVDGGSTDGSVEIIEKYADRLAWWVSEPDGGYVEALNKGFARSTGDIMAWLNSDDLYFPNSLFAVAEIFGQFPQVNWLMGMPTEFTPEGAAIARTTLPYARWSEWRYLCWDFQFIMQEATFWRRKVWEEAGKELDPGFPLAADTALWAKFFRKEKLYTTTTQLGGFRHRRSGQLSRERLQEYLGECREVIRAEFKRLPILQRFWLFWHRFIGFFWGIPYFLDIPLLRKPYEWLFGIPPVISYDFQQQRYFFGRKQLKFPPLFLGGKQVSREGRK